jgi:hypothetical protein
LRRQGARGGKIFGRNHRARRALMPPPPPALPGAEAKETTGAAIATLDAQFPVAEKCGKAGPKLSQ